MEEGAPTEGRGGEAEPTRQTQGRRRGRPRGQATPRLLALHALGASARAVVGGSALCADNPAGVAGGARKARLWLEACHLCMTCGRHGSVVLHPKCESAASNRHLAPADRRLMGRPCRPSTPTLRMTAWRPAESLALQPGKLSPSTRPRKKPIGRLPHSTSSACAGHARLCLRLPPRHAGGPRAPPGSMSAASVRRPARRSMIL